MTDSRVQSAILLIGTNKGVYRASTDNIDEARRVLEADGVMRLHHYKEKSFAATRSGLFKSTDHGETWTNLEVPQNEVYAVLQSPDGRWLYAGTHPAHLYISEDGGDSWREMEGLQKLPSRSTWHTPRHRNEAHVRSLVAHPDVPERVIAGIEVGGVHISEDNGETWAERREGLHDDVHHLLVLGTEEYIASTGGGIYRTRDAGRSWTRLGKDLDYTYFREAFAAGGRLYAAAARSSPPSWGGKRGADAALFESTDGGNSFESVPYPGQPREFILAWTGSKGDSHDVFAGTTGGSVLHRKNDKWTKIGSISARIHALVLL